MPIKLGIRTYWTAGGLETAVAFSVLKLDKPSAYGNNATTVRILFIWTLS